MDYKVTLTFFVTPEIKAKFKAICAIQGISMTDWIMLRIDDFISQNERDIKRVAAVK